MSMGDQEVWGFERDSVMNGAILLRDGEKRKFQGRRGGTAELFLSTHKCATRDISEGCGDYSRDGGSKVVLAL